MGIKGCKQEKQQMREECTVSVRSTAAPAWMGRLRRICPPAEAMHSLIYPAMLFFVSCSNLGNKSSDIEIRMCY